MFDECDWTWVSETIYTETGPISGFYGYRVTSKKNSASIFLPAAGRHNNDEDSSGIEYVNTSGWYWATTSALQRGGSSQTRMYANSVYFDSDSYELYEGTKVTKTPIYIGCSVRPVVIQ